jgi:hypothetical protein
VSDEPVSDGNEGGGNGGVAVVLQQQLRRLSSTATQLQLQLEVVPLAVEFRSTGKFRSPCHWQWNCFKNRVGLYGNSDVTVCVTTSHIPVAVKQPSHSH